MRHADGPSHRGHDSVVGPLGLRHRLILLVGAVHHGDQEVHQKPRALGLLSFFSSEEHVADQGQGVEQDHRDEPLWDL